MPTRRECVCCYDIPEVLRKMQEMPAGSVTSITNHPGFDNVCLDIWVLQAASYNYLQQYGRNASYNGPIYK